MPEMTVQEAMQLALQHHRAGNLKQADAIYQRILANDPRNADASHLLGVVRSMSGKHDAALELIRGAISISPQTGDYHASLGRVLAAQGKLDDAIAAYRLALVLNPNLPACRNALGIALLNRDQKELAVSVFQEAAARHPDFAEFHYNLGNALRGAGRTGEAITAYQKAIELRPDMHPAYENLGNAFQSTGDFGLAIEKYRQAIALAPQNAQLHYNLGHALQQAGQLEQAVAEYEQALKLKPDLAPAAANAGSALLAMGQIDPAIERFKKAIEIGAPDPNDSTDYALARCNLGLTLLLKGDFENGWREYEWRIRSPDSREFCRMFPQSRWDGQKLAGKTLFVHTEQGFGDAIQFARYLPLVAEKSSANVVLQCQPELVRLLRSMKGNGQAFHIVSSSDPSPTFDVQCPLLSLPGIFNTHASTIPADVPYLFADAELAQKWGQRLADDNGRKRIGLAWAGRATHLNDRNRSIPLELLEPLLQVKRVRFCSLQKPGLEKRPSSSRCWPEVIDWSSELADFADTAALVSQLDLVITVDTSVAHLAGAMEKPVWLLLPFVPDWRWLLGRTDTPWYPTMRLFRQSSRGDWSGPIKAVADLLLGSEPL